MEKTNVVLEVDFDPTMSYQNRCTNIFENRQVYEDLGFYINPELRRVAPVWPYLVVYLTIHIGMIVLFFFARG